MNHVVSLSKLLRVPECRRRLFTTMSQAYATEEQVAIAAVRRACHLTSSVFNKLVRNETLTKGDKSPVTGASLVSDFRKDNLARS